MLERMDPAIVRAKRRQRDVTRRRLIGGSCRLARANGAASEPPSPAIETSARDEDAVLQGTQGAEEAESAPTAEIQWAASFTARQRHRRAEQVGQSARRLSSGEKAQRLLSLTLVRSGGAGSTRRRRRRSRGAPSPRQRRTPPQQRQLASPGRTLSPRHRPRGDWAPPRFCSPRRWACRLRRSRGRVAAARPLLQLRQAPLVPPTAGSRPVAAAAG